MIRISAAVAAALAVLGHSGGATAKDEAVSAAKTPDFLEARPPPTERSFYGWPIIAVGELGAVMTSASLVLPDRLLSTNASTVGFIAGVPTFVLAGPLVHWSHDEFGKGVISVAANLTLPVIGAVIGRGISCSGSADEDCAYHGFGAGFAVVALILPVADALALGWEDLPVDYVAAAPPRPAFRIAPRVEVGRAGVLRLGVVGTF